MDLASEELQFSRIADILKESVSIPKQSPKTFYLITLTLIFPLSFAILAHSLFHAPPSSRKSKSTQLAPPLAGQNSSFSSFSTSSFYLPSLFSRPPPSSSPLHPSTPPRSSLFPPQSLPSLAFSSDSLLPSYVFLSMIVYNIIFLGFLVLPVIAVDTHNVFLFIFSTISALWHLASVVSVLEPVYGFAAMKKSYPLLKRMTVMGFVLVFVYLTVCGVINALFGSIGVHGGDDYGVLARIIVGGFLVGVLVIVNLIGLLVQSVFYYVCKIYHHQGIDKSALYDHLGGYLGEYVPLTSSIQMENLEA